MDRRTFIVSTAAAATAVTSAGEALAAGMLPARNGTIVDLGRDVTLSGWLKPGEHGPGHYFVLAPTGDARDPASSDLSGWTKGYVRVLPADTARMRTGKVRLKGRLFQGAYGDIVTGHVAGAVLTGAELA
jgi:hypothetical protein